MHLQLMIDWLDSSGATVSLQRTVCRPYPSVPRVGEQIYADDGEEWLPMTVKQVVHRNDGGVRLLLRLADADPLRADPTSSGAGGSRTPTATRPSPRPTSPERSGLARGT